MDHDGPSNNFGDDVDREVKRKKNEEESKDTDYEPSHPAPSAGTSMAVSPIQFAQNNGTMTVQATPSVAANLDVVDGCMASSTPGKNKLHDLGVVTPNCLVAKEDAVHVHGTCTPRTSIETPGEDVHGACIGVVGTLIGRPPSSVHGPCSLGTSIVPGTTTSSPALVSSSPTEVPSQNTVSNGTTSLPMVTPKRTYVHTVTPKRSSQMNTMVSTLPMSVKERADLDTTKSIIPGIMTTPVSKAFSSEEVIACGGIKSQEAKGIRSSGRLRAQPNADATQLEKAMLLTQRRNEIFEQGNSSSCALDTVMGFPATGGSAQGYGYWLQQTAGGYAGLLLPGYWVAT
ncbi:hypothetical protein ACQ4PT_031567 [Festuca glaucescens]